GPHHLPGIERHRSPDEPHVPIGYGGIRNGRKAGRAEPRAWQGIERRLMGVVVAELDPRVREDTDAGGQEHAVIAKVLVRIDPIYEGTGGRVVVRRDERWPAGGLVVIGDTHPELIRL